MKVFVSTLVLLFLFTPFSPLAGHLFANEGNVIINELIPNPVGSDTIYEWIELYNYSEAEVNLHGWKVDGKLIPDSTISPKGFLILVRDLTSYTEIENKVKVDFNLVNTGDQIELRDQNDNIIDQFIYTSSTEGRSLERFGPDCEGYSQHQILHTLSSQNSNYSPECYFEVEDQPPITPNIIFSIDQLTWYDSIESDHPVEIFFKFDTDELSDIIWSDKDGKIISSPWLFDGYSGKIFAQVFLTDEEKIIQSNDIIIKPYLSQKIQISELYPNVNSGEEEWIELFNFDDRPIDLSQYYLNDSGDCSIGAQNFLVGIIEPSSYIVKFKTEFKITLNDGGDSILLCDRKQFKVDELIYSKSTKGKSISKRFVDNRYINQIYESEPSPGNFNIEVAEDVLELIEIRKTQSLDQNTKVRVQGYIISLMNSIFQNTFFIQDNSSGLRVYSDLGIDLILGQKVEIEGTISRINGDDRVRAEKITKINDFKEFETRELSLQMIEGQIGTRVRVEGYIANNYSSSFDITYNSDLIRVSILKEDILSSIQKSKGDFVSVSGILTFDKDKFRILPETQNDIKITYIEEAKSPSTSRVSRGTLKIENTSDNEVKGVEYKNIVPQQRYLIEDTNEEINKTGPILMASSFLALIFLSFSKSLIRFFSSLKKLFVDREEIILPMK